MLPHATPARLKQSRGHILNICWRPPQFVSPRPSRPLTWKSNSRLPAANGIQLRLSAKCSQGTLLPLFLGFVGFILRSGAHPQPKVQAGTCSSLRLAPPASSWASLCCSTGSARRCRASSRPVESNFSSPAGEGLLTEPSPRLHLNACVVWLPTSTEATASSRSPRSAAKPSAGSAP